ncbi:MAG: UDP-N-acetylmuramoyl-L-alanine--D-glutamate ligase, partial [Comamonas sp.]|nr:UDP-N-acetylmuramoyl-L-alanine--D-glutamate ligase [Candidatus Comamonas equi]
MHADDFNPDMPATVYRTEVEGGAQDLGATSPDIDLVLATKEAETEQMQGQQAPEIRAPAATAQVADATIPDLSTLTAAKDAAAFVAQIFADPSISDAAQADVTAVLPTPDAAEAPELPPVPAQWPQGQPQYLQGQRVLILGLGASGMAMVRWCVRAGAQVTVADTREAPPQLSQLNEQWPQVRFIGGALSAALVEGQNLSAVYRSPGLAPETIACVVNAARAIGLPVGGELDLFAAALQGLQTGHGYQPKVLAVTGTNGKTTVTSLTSKLLEHAGVSVGVAGNIGPTLL